MKPPAMLVAATRSGAGKTTFSLGLALALRARGFDVAPAKAGPDYIDAGWLTAFAGKPALNLDVWMAFGRKGSLEKLMALALESCRKPFFLVEGAMGLYDGDRSGRSSCAELAALLGLPVLLLLDVKGMGQSCAALAGGFLNFLPSWTKETGAPKFCGLICSRVGSKKHRNLLARSLSPVLAKAGVPLLGMLPGKDAPRLPGRHLGLLQAREEGGRVDRQALLAWIETNCDIDGLLQSLGAVSSARQWPGAAPHPQPPHLSLKSKAGPVVAIARDEAFSFCYADTPLLLAGLGARIRYFSPLRDEAPPPCEAIYISGGYPELFAEKLSANLPMLAALRLMAALGTPIYGECGGYMYLLGSIETESGIWPMTGLLPGQCFTEKRLAGLGYREGRLLPGPDFAPPEAPVRGHEFHYWQVRGGSGPCLWRWRDSAGEDLGCEGSRKGCCMGSWLHLYPEGSRDFWKFWLSLAISNRKRR